MSANSGSPLRPLLPAIVSARRKPPDDGDGDQQASKRQRVSAACEPCRARKTKCDGERPACGECDAKQTACRYAETEARKVRHKYEQLRSRQSVLEQLFEFLRTAPEQDSFEILRRIRTGSDAETLLNQIQEGNLLMRLSRAGDSPSI